jgi:uncharacterized membrane protein (GlpM family)
MLFFLKIVISLAVILTASAIAKKMPSAAGLISVMPLTGALVLIWVYIDNKGSPEIMRQFVKGALWGILPSILFFLTAFFCFKRNLSLPTTVASSFAIWFGAALAHQWLIK